jgi:DNA-binding response OmpR family regulator
MTERSDSQPTVLVVDDDSRVRLAIQWALEDAGLRVLTAEDGARAIEQAVAAAPAVIVLDMTLPVLDGYEVAESVRATHGESVPILVITADGHAAEKADRVGAYAYVRKPFDVGELVDAVRRGIDDSRPRKIGR